MIAAAEHLVVAPVVVPLAVGALLLAIDERRHGLKAAISLAASILLVVLALALAARAEAPVTHVYRLGNWPASFGIVLVADRLSALLVLLAAALGAAAGCFSLARWDRAGPQFHSLVQFLLAGLNGAFLTGDLFNLFVFFELLLVASYGLALHGSGTARVRSSLHYIVINLSASLLFLVGVSLMYGVTGTLNLADLALRVAELDAADRVLLDIGAATLGLAFLVKAGMWPLGFWLAPTYSAAASPAAALFSILSKVGIYAVVRVWLVVFGGGAGAEFLAYGGMATLVFGMAGTLSSPEMRRIASYSLLVSSGTLLAAVGLGGAAATAAALYYLVASTLGIAALFLLIELLERAREPGADILAVTAEAFGLGEEEEREPEEEVGVVIPATMALLGFSFVCAALLIAGLPPLPGFIAKFALLDALLDASAVPRAVWALLALVLASGLAAVISLGRVGVRLFWPAQERSIPRVRVVEMLPVAVLLAACLALTVGAGPAMRFVQHAAESLHAPAGYIQEVLRLP
jgi:multicomponent K+:H+ antiporter subunit D